MFTSSLDVGGQDYEQKNNQAESGDGAGLRHENSKGSQNFANSGQVHQRHGARENPARIEVLTEFYKHPIEIAANSVIASAIIFSLLGGSVQAGAWFNVFAAVGEYFYHANLRTPRWFGYFIQRPEHHSIHHQLDVHDFNFGDITWWDRLFGTFKKKQMSLLHSVASRAGVRRT